MMTLAPFLTNSAAVAFPMPLAAPVMTATFPANLRRIQIMLKQLDPQPNAQE
jgi:hypothetical protein